MIFKLIALLVIDPGAWVDLAVAPARIGSTSTALPADFSWVVLASAVATAGSSGVGLLSLSNYVRDKGFGMGARMPRIISPITGREEAGSQIGYLFPRNEENLRRWHEWWRVARSD
jgi:hypothetical protein